MHGEGSRQSGHVHGRCGTGRRSRSVRIVGTPPASGIPGIHPPVARAPLEGTDRPGATDGGAYPTRRLGGLERGGTTRPVRAGPPRIAERQATLLTIRLKRQAHCFPGMWSHPIGTRTVPLDAGDAFRQTVL